MSNFNQNIKQFIDPNINNQGTYLVIKDKEAILIDASNAVQEAITYAKENKITITNLIITHGHFDHILGIDQLLTAFPNVTIYINQWDEDCLFSAKRNFSSKRDLNITVKNPIKNLIALTGDITTKLIGLTVNIVHIPGHTPGSQYILIKEYNAVFIGDTIFYDKIGFYDIDYCDNKYFKKSLVELTQLDKKLNVYPGHHQIFNLKTILTNNQILKEFLQTNEKEG